MTLCGALLRGPEATALQGGLVFKSQGAPPSSTTRIGCYRLPAGAERSPLQQSLAGRDPRLLRAPIAENSARTLASEGSDRQFGLPGIRPAGRRSASAIAHGATSEGRAHHGATAFQRFRFGGRRDGDPRDGNPYRMSMGSRVGGAPDTDAPSLNSRSRAGAPSSRENQRRGCAGPGCSPRSAGAGAACPSFFAHGQGASGLRDIRPPGSRPLRTGCGAGTAGVRRRARRSWSVQSARLIGTACSALASRASTGFAVE